MSKDRAKNRQAHVHEAATTTADTGHEHHERQLSMKASEERASGKGEAITPPQHHKTPKQSKSSTKQQATKPKQAGKGRPTPKQSGPRTPTGKKRGHTPRGKADGPLARRRRFRVRALLIVLLVLNVTAAAVWRDWTVTLAVLIVSLISAPLLAALLLRRR